ncbi:MAG TPA: regulatory protein RecX [Bacteroidales bacterium]|nr:regulatory protein RecX [Bacteroidales bacterium]
METIKSQDDYRYKELLEKARNFCAFRERSTHETKVKLLQIGANSLEAEKALLQLKEEGFLSDLRFASVFVRGKFNQNQWGRAKIIMGLTAHRISKETISEALQEIDNDKYIATLKSIVKKKLESLKGQTEFIVRGKTIGFCLGKGFESDLTQEILDSLLNRNL